MKADQTRAATRSATSEDVEQLATMMGINIVATNNNQGIC